eukprot:8142093-Pyramimonas_sp.AAC.1
MGATLVVFRRDLRPIPGRPLEGIRKQTRQRRSGRQVARQVGALLTSPLPEAGLRRQGSPGLSPR